MTCKISSHSHIVEFPKQVRDCETNILDMTIYFSVSDLVETCDLCINDLGVILYNVTAFI